MTAISAEPEMLLLDSAFVLALAFRQDQNHLRAKAFWDGFRSSPRRLVTTSMVLAEVTAFCISRRRHDLALLHGDYLLKSRLITMVHCDEDLVAGGWSYFRNHPDKTYSLTDCISFVLMEREGIREALSFDHHFEQAGFIRLPAA